MKNRKIFLPALFSIVLVFSLILPASEVGASATVPLLGDHFISRSPVDGSRLAPTIALNAPQGQIMPMVAVDAEAENDKWTLSDAALQFQLTVNSTEGGSVTTPGEGTFTYDEGTVVDLVAETEEVYHFINWTGNVSTIADVNAASTNITMNGNYSITANFVRQYDLTISSTTGGNVTTPGVGNFTYDAGTVVNLVATPDVGYRFVNWVGNVSTIANVNAAATNITMNSDYSVTANFVRQYNLTITSTTGGMVTTPGVGTFTCDAGTVVNLVATPNAGYQFVNWTGDTATLSCHCHSTTITMNGDYAITANFAVATRCFIATVVYGTPMAKKIQILREFRDKYLFTNPVGKGFVDFYYRVSPPIAELITAHPSLKPIVRTGLLPAVFMSTIAVNTTLAEKIAIIGSLVLVSVALAIWTMRRRGRGQWYI